MPINATRVVKIALFEPEPNDAVWIEWLLFMAGVSTDVARVDWPAAGKQADIGDAAIILIGLQRLGAPERAALMRLRAGYPRIPLVILAGSDASSWVGEAVRLGALHVLHKSQLTPEALSSTIRHCAD